MSLGDNFGHIIEMKSFLHNMFGTDISVYGTSLAQKIAKRYPIDLDGKGKVSADRITRILEQTYGDAQTYQSEHRLGWLGRTRLCHAFKWRLHELGYSKLFIDLATEGLIVYLSKPSPAPNRPA